MNHPITIYRFPNGSAIASNRAKRTAAIIPAWATEKRLPMPRDEAAHALRQLRREQKNIPRTRL